MEKLCIWIGKCVIAVVATEAIVGIVDTTIRAGRALYELHMEKKLQKEKQALEQKAEEVVR